MKPRPLRRAEDIKESIVRIRTLLTGKTFDDLRRDWQTGFAFERLLEILSEAARHLPEAWRRRYGPELPWVQIFDLGNILRHAYHRREMSVLWDIYQNDLDPLERVIDAMLAGEAAPE